MFHTYELIIKIESEEEFENYRNIFSVYSSKNRGKFFPSKRDKNEYIMNATKGKGIIWSLAKHFKKERVFYYLKAKVNPGVLIDQDYINPISSDEISTLIKEFDMLSRAVSEHMPRFSDYKINRIDYCINLDIKEIGKGLSPQEIMKIIRRSDKPRGYKEFMKYDKSAKKSKPPKDSYYLINGSVNVNIYDKYEQLKKEKKDGKIPDWVPIEEAQNIIRFEIQCKQSKMKELRETYDIKKHDHESILSSEMCEEVLLSYFRKIIGPGEYYTIQTAKKIIEKSDYADNEKKEMVNALELVSLKRSIRKARESLDSKSKKKSFNEALDNLRQLNINPVTIPRDWDIKSIPSLEDYIIKEIKK